MVKSIIWVFELEFSIKTSYQKVIETFSQHLFFIFKSKTLLFIFNFY